MDKFVIAGAHPLKGKIKAGGSKNSALPILLASLLTDEECVIRRVPLLRDIETTFKLLEYHGKKVTYNKGTVTIKPHHKLRTDAPYELVKQMRASVLVAGPLLARFHKASVPLPGGCAIGMRPIDIHITALAKMGAKIDNSSGNLILKAAKLHPAKIQFPFPSVGATEHLMMCAAIVPGTTVLDNVAMEPEIDDLMDFLLKMGAHMRREQGCRIVIEGVKELHGAEHDVIADRVETGTYLLAGAATGGCVTVQDCCPEHLASLLDHMSATGIRVTYTANSITVDARKARPKAVSIHTQPHPGFPTDLQAPWMSLMCVSRGSAEVKEDIFENRFMHAPELARMGALIAVDGHTAALEGVDKLSGAEVMASDIRGGAALVVAGLAAHGQTTVQRIYHIDRGYERMEKKLTALGAKIRRVSDRKKA